MTRVNDSRTIARREEVLALWTRGASVTRISTTLKLDWRTVKRDVAFVARQAAAELDVPTELNRLLLSARAVELDRWAAKAPLQALGAMKVQLGILQAMQALEVEARLKAIEERLDAIQGVQPWMAPRVRAAVENGTGRG